MEKEFDLTSSDLLNALLLTYVLDQSGLDVKQWLDSVHRPNFPFAHRKPLTSLSLLIRDYNPATLSVRADIEAIKDPHACICS